jgi:hypothetical protein
MSIMIKNEINEMFIKSNNIDSSDLNYSNLNYKTNYIESYNELC